MFECLPVFLCTVCKPGTQVQKWESGLLELEVEKVVCHHVDAGTKPG